MDTFDKARLERIFGKFVLSEPDYTDDFHPFSNQDLSFLDTPEKRSQYFLNFFQKKGLRRTGSISVRLHQNFTIGYLEYQASLKEHIYATKIQKHVKGMLTRMKTGIHNPNCEIGKAWISKCIFEI